MDKPVYLTAQMSVETALRALNRSGGHMGVIRQGSRDIGIVTRKDLVEPLVGELEEW
jgi:CBS domain containing-hemolysin-like protein